MPEQVFLFDTVSLSNFALAQSLDLLVSRHEDCLCVTPEVLDELTAGIVAGYSALNGAVVLVGEGVFSSVVLTHEERQVFLDLRDNLGAGEASCLAGASCRGAIVVTDDRAARTSCAERSISFTGTIGILKAMCRDGQISLDEADKILSTMISNGFYSPVSRIRDVL
jgi:predicted nucleic acid-binding protein